MEILYSKIIGMPVFVPENPRPLCIVQDIVIDPVSGKIIAFVVDSRRGLIVTPMDVFSMKHGVLIRDADDIVLAEDILSVKKIQSDEKLFHKRVETETGKQLGIVVDIVIDDRSLTLNKLYTAKTFLGIIQFDGRVIAAKNIVEIRKNKVVVKDDSGEVRDAERGEAEMAFSG